MDNEKSRIRGTSNNSTNADSGTDIFSAGIDKGADIIFFADLDKTKSIDNG